MKKIALIFIAAFTFGIANAEYPDQPVSFVVPFPPGDLEDVLTRIIADEFQSQTGTAAAVINKPGGGGGPFPGAMEVAAGPNDGSQIGSFVVGIPVVGPKVGIDGLTAETFEPIGIFLTYPFVLAASADAPYSNMQELADYAKENKIALGHFGAPLIPTKVSLAAATALGFEYGSDAPFDALDCNTLASGDADLINTTLQLILPCIDNVNVLATITGERINKLPDTPTMAEIVPELNMSLWNGLFVKQGTPQEIKDKIAEIAKAAVLGEKAQKIAEDTGALVYWQDAAQAAEIIAADSATFDTVNSMLE